MRADRIAAAEKRAEEAEITALVKARNENGGTEAGDAQQLELNLYMDFLNQIEGLTDPMRRVLAHLGMFGTPYRACLESGVPARTYYAWIADRPGFRELTEEFKKLSADRLERVAVALATGEYMRPLVSQGRIAAYERIYDTKALITLLKARKPEQFQQRIDVTSNGHSLVKLIDREAWDSV